MWRKIIQIAVLSEYTNFYSLIYLYRTLPVYDIHYVVNSAWVNESAAVAVLSTDLHVLDHWVISKWTSACIHTKQDLLCGSGLCSCRYCMSLLCSCVLSLCRELSLCLRADSRLWIRSTCFSTRDVWDRERVREEKEKKRGKGTKMNTKVKDYERLKLKHQKRKHRE